MVLEASIIELAAWMRSAPGQCLLRWEQQHLDQAVADVFGYHALQLGLPELQGLRANRMPHRWVASDSMQATQSLPLPDEIEPISLPFDANAALHCDFDALPFPNQSLDLVVLPHALELARDAHDTLREVERVLVPEGRIVITGFNPASLWGLRQRAGRLRRGMGFGGGLFLPRAGDLIGYWRLRDWLRLLGFEVERGRFGCWRPPFRSQRWIDRGGWIDRAGERWWPVLGASYCLVAVKRVRGMRMVGLARSQKPAKASAPAAVAQPRVRQLEEHLEEMG